MKNFASLSLLFILLLSCTGQEVSDQDYQIKTGVLAAPEHQRAEATVLGYNRNGEMVMLREGTNDFVCIADNPTKEGFSVAAYHKSLEPFMTRGRELKAQGLNAKEVFDKREKEVAAGTLEMPDKATLYVSTGDLNEETGEIDNFYTRYVIYIPYATEESTGMPLSPPAPGAPWIMDPGTHRAHIMINPPKN
ncbi:hypothetical protein [Ekhidna sp.]|uniref:hypothetical protein n=1 Tax=Ekhidna sp. TaxID=2608089 RepID=UPI0032997F5A